MKKLKKKEEEMERSKVIDQENEASPDETTTITCVYCGENMFPYVMPRFNRYFGIIILAVGVLLALFMSPLFGLPVVVIGAYMGVASRSTWICESCGSVVERIKA